MLLLSVRNVFFFFSFLARLCVSLQLLGMLDMSVPAVAKFRRLLDSLPREMLPDVVASMIRTSNKEKLQVRTRLSIKKAAKGPPACGVTVHSSQVLDAVSLEERFRRTLPMLTRQIEGLKLLKKSRKMTPGNEKRVCYGPGSCESVPAACLPLFSSSSCTGTGTIGGQG